MHAQVRPSRLQPSSDNDYRYASRSVPLPNLEDKDLPSEIAPPLAMSANVPRTAAECRVLRAYAPLYGAPGGSGRLESPRVALPEG